MKNSLMYKTKNCWEVYKDTASLKAIDKLAQQYITFLSSCKTERETIEMVISLLHKSRYSEDFTKKLVYRTYKGKAVFIACKGKKRLQDSMRIISVHTDSPRLDFKQRPLKEQVAIGQAKTHYYGGIRKYQWLARPLAIHGVVVREKGTPMNVTLGEEQGEPVFTILDLLPHLAQKEVKKTIEDAFDAEKLNVVLGHSPIQNVSIQSKKKISHTESIKNPIKEHIIQLLHQKYIICEEDLLSAELQVVPAGPAHLVGLDGSLIGGYGQDDRVCVFTALMALLDSKTPEYTSCLIFWDKEEIGSEGSTGAQSKFFEYFMEDLLESWEPKTKLRDVFQHAKAISADVHAAIDPDWQELHEELNAATIGYGSSFSKYTGSKGKYGANDAHPEYIGWLRNILNKKGIPWQMAELGKVDLGGGGTVAHYLAVYGMDTIDFGQQFFQCIVHLSWYQKWMYMLQS